MPKPERTLESAIAALRRSRLKLVREQRQHLEPGHSDKHGYGGPKRLGRSVEAHQMRDRLYGAERSKGLRLQLWPDAYEAIAADAHSHGMSLSGMGHTIIRRYYGLPPIPHDTNPSL